MAQIADGSPEAAWEVIERYSTNILRAVRRHLPAELRGKFDSLDVVQSVWKSLLAKNQNFEGLGSPQDFVAYVAGMAKLKTLEAHRRYRQTSKRDVRREVTGRVDDLPVKGGRAAAAQPGASRQADGGARRKTDTPASIAEVKERWSQSLKACGPRTTKILELRLQRVPDEEIAARLGISRSTIRRELQTLMECFVA